MKILSPRCLSFSDPQDTGMVSWSHHERGGPQNDHATRPSRRVRTTVECKKVGRLILGILVRYDVIS